MRRFHNQFHRIAMLAGCRRSRPPLPSEMQNKAQHLQPSMVRAAPLLLLLVDELMFPVCSRAPLEICAGSAHVAAPQSAPMSNQKPPLRAASQRERDCEHKGNFSSHHVFLTRTLTLGLPIHPRTRTHKSRNFPVARQARHLETRLFAPGARRLLLAPPRVGPWKAT